MESLAAAVISECFHMRNYMQIQIIETKEPLAPAPAQQSQNARVKAEHRLLQSPSRFHVTPDLSQPSTTKYHN